MTWKFAKMTGAANDFIVLDRRGAPPEEWSADTIRRLCARRFSVGADGLMLLGSAPDADFSMRYFNADGSEAAMCGNGGRCLARFAVLVGAGQEGRELSFTAPSGRYRAWVHGEQVRLGLIAPPSIDPDVQVRIGPGDHRMDVLDTGVPHAVVFVPDTDQVDVTGLGRAIRRHERFAPAGTNVNFARVLDPHRLVLRTYERGVEDETLACGTGAAAAALAAARRGWVQSPVTVETRSGAELVMRFDRSPEGRFANVFQTGEARVVFWGETTEESLRYTFPTL